MGESARLTPEELVSRLAEMAKITPEQVRALLQAQAELAVERVRGEYPVPGIGLLTLIDTPPRSMLMQFGPKKGQTIDIPARKKLTFRVCKMIKDVAFGNPKTVPDLFAPEDLEATWYWYPPEGEPED